MSEKTPRRVGRAATGHRLGDLVHIYDTRPRAVVWVLLLGSAGAALLAAGYFYLIDNGLWVAAPSVALAMGYLGAAGWILGRGVLRGPVVYRFEYGFVRINPFQIYAWDELTSVTVTAVQSSRRARIGWRFTVERADGRSTVLGGELPGVQALGEDIVAELTDRLVPQYVKTVSTGGTVELGPFGIDALGVTKDGDLVPWAYIRSVTIDNGVVSVRGPGDVAVLSATVGRVPNAVAFTALCRSMLQQKTGGPIQYP